jgi:hypothetical protein
MHRLVVQGQRPSARERIMTEIANRRIQAQYLSDWSLVRLPDGRVGVFTKRNQQGRVTLPGQTGVDVSLGETLDLVKHPAELAAEALDRHYANES